MPLGQSVVSILAGRSNRTGTESSYRSHKKLTQQVGAGFWGEANWVACLVMPSACRYMPLAVCHGGAWGKWKPNQ